LEQFFIGKLECAEEEKKILKNHNEEAFIEATNTQVEEYCK
jgi:hypothetical protein